MSYIKINQPIIYQNKINQLIVLRIKHKSQNLGVCAIRSLFKGSILFPGNTFVSAFCELLLLFEVLHNCAKLKKDDSTSVISNVECDKSSQWF